MFAYKGKVFGTLGFSVVCVTVFLGEFYNPTSFSARFGLQFLGHFGIALFVLGVVGFLMEVKDWQEYFERRLANTIQKREFLQTLQNDRLKILLKDVFLAYYKVDDLDRDSFLEFFNTKIQDYIGGPFREDTESKITIQRPGPNGCSRVEEDLSYTCRKIKGKASTIQTDVAWSADAPDIEGVLGDYSVELTIPREWQETFSSPPGFPPCNEGKIILKNGHEKLVKLSEGHGFELSIREFKDIDKLRVHEHVEYSIPTDRFFVWVMRYPTRKLTATFNYPQDDFEFVVERFGMDDASLGITPQRGSYSLSYGSWLMPENGMAYRFKRKDASPHPTIAAVAAENMAGEKSDANGFLRKGVEASQPPAEDVVAKSPADKFEMNRSVRRGVDPSQHTTESVAEKGTNASEFDDTTVKKSYDQFSGTKVGT